MVKRGDGNPDFQHTTDVEIEGSKIFSSLEMLLARRPSCSGWSIAAKYWHAIGRFTQNVVVVVTQ
jgi:hypothetical protein